MNRTMRFAVLVALLLLTSWLGASPKAQADPPYCGDIQGMACTNPGYYIYCCVGYDDCSKCTCSPTINVWICE